MVGVEDVLGARNFAKPTDEFANMKTPKIFILVLAKSWDHFMTVFWMQMVRICDVFLSVTKSLSWRYVILILMNLWQEFKICFPLLNIQSKQNWHAFLSWRTIFLSFQYWVPSFVMDSVNHYNISLGQISLKWISQNLCFSEKTEKYNEKTWRFCIFPILALQASNTFAELFYIFDDKAIKLSKKRQRFRIFVETKKGSLVTWECSVV